MQFIQFNSTDEMLAHLRHAAEEARHGLHSEQARLTWGDHWVQFHDIANRHIIFGRVHTAQQVADEEIDAGGTEYTAATAVDQAEITLNNGYLYGRAYDRYNRDGELGTTHKAHVWPIEERLFNQAAETNWQIELLPQSGRVLLEIAFRAMRAHVRGE